MSQFSSSPPPLRVLLLQSSRFNSTLSRGEATAATQRDPLLVCNLFAEGAHVDTRPKLEFL